MELESLVPSVHVFKAQYHFGSIELHLVLVEHSVLKTIYVSY
jgi:hypothetical protein